MLFYYTHGSASSSLATFETVGAPKTSYTDKGAEVIPKNSPHAVRLAYPEVCQLAERSLPEMAAFIIKLKNEMEQKK